MSVSAASPKVIVYPSSRWVRNTPAERTQDVDVVGHTRPPGTIVDVDPRSRALAIWPGLDRRKLTRTCGDPHRIARLVERRTALSRASILRLLGVDPVDA